MGGGRCDAAGPAALAASKRAAHPAAAVRARPAAADHGPSNAHRPTLHSPCRAPARRAAGRALRAAAAANQCHGLSGKPEQSPAGAGLCGSSSQVQQ